MSKWMMATKRADFNAIAAKYNINPVLARIIRNRDIIEDKDIDKFLNGFSDQTIIYITCAILTVFLIDCVHSFIKALDIRNLQIRLNKAIDYMSNSLSNVKTSIEKKIEKGNNKLSTAKSESIEQFQELIDQFELRFSKRGKASEKNKYSSRYFHNNLQIEKTSRKNLERLKDLIDSIKANLFENEEKQ